MAYQPLPRLPLLAVVGLALGGTGCAGGAPLLHPAHVLRTGQVAVGAGLSGQFTTQAQNPPVRAGDNSAPVLDSLTVAPGVSPWVAGRVGIQYGFEGGITYTGRELRIDGRRAFPVGPFTLSLGLGGTALVPRSLPGDSGSVAGGGGDLPVLLGWSSTADLYSVWFGPRAGFEIFKGNVADTLFDPLGEKGAFSAVSGHHLYVGGVAGFWVGFRYLHAALELDVAYHTAAGTIGTTDVVSHNVSVAPAGAIILSF